MGTSSICTKCGDGRLSGIEICDNQNSIGCSKNCQPDPGYECTGKIGERSICKPKCGDGIVLGN